MIYLARRQDGRVKIGYTSGDPSHRLRSLKTGAGALELLGTMPGDTKLERALHDRYSSYRVEGEWFDLSQDHIEEVLAVAQVRTSVGSVYLRGSVYWIKYYVGGRVVSESTGQSDKREAKRILAERTRAASIGAPKLLQREAEKVESWHAKVQRIEREHHEEMRRLNLNHEAALRRKESRSIETAPADVIPEIIAYILTRLQRGDVLPNESRVERLRVWSAAATAAIRELETIKAEAAGSD